MTPAEFKYVVLPVGNKLFRFARMLLGDEEEARDAVQETFLKLWKIRDELAGIRNLDAYAMKLTRNWCLDRLKAKKPLLIENYYGTYNRSHEGENPHSILENEDRVKRLISLLKILPPQQRMILNLRDIQGYEFSEITEMTGISMNNVRVNLSRARTKLREELIKMDRYGQEKSRPSSA